MDKLWVRVRQEAGPLVKEVRFQRPRRAAEDQGHVRQGKNEIIRAVQSSAFRRTPTDRLELLLGLFGAHGRTYTLTFMDECLPPSFPEVRKTWRRCLSGLRRDVGRPIDYVYCIEGRHGDHRYHIHLVVSDLDFSPPEVRMRWPGGHIEHKPLLLSPQDDYRRTARYLTKERTDGVIIPIGARTWVASRSLTARLPAPTRTLEQSGVISPPINARVLSQRTVKNPYGEFRFCSFLRS